MILVTGTQRRGAEVVAENLAASLAQTGWRADLVALRDSGSVATIQATPLVDRSHKLNGLRPGVVRKLRRLIRTKAPDVVLAGGGATLKYSVSALLGFRRPPKLVYASIGEPKYWARSPSSRRLLSWLLSRTNHVSAVSHATARQLVDDFGVPEDKVSVVHPGIPESMIDQSPREPSERLRVLYLGSISAEKNPLAALDAVKRCAFPVSLRFVGDGPSMAELARRSTGMDNVELVGAVADVKPHLLWAEALILTSATEGLPGVILEAAAHGLPVVSYDVGGVREAVEDGITGFVVPHGDVQSVAERLDLLAGDAGLRRRMGAAGREKVLSEFGQAESVSRSRAVLASVVGR
ncbi:MAG TPA: glycosyltransferase family 4 protein [Acidimicrobiia bacterium]